MEDHTLLCSTVEDLLEVRFTDKQILVRALTHRSYLNEHTEVTHESNETLEFLGDAVLSYLVATELYQKAPDLSEGELTIARAQLVNNNYLATVANDLRLGEHLLLGQGVKKKGASPDLLACALEAVIGGIWLDQGIDSAKNFVLTHFQDRLIEASVKGDRRDYKTRLQELSQARWGIAPEYKTLEKTADVSSPIFIAEAMVSGKVLGTGSGFSKQTAQLEAAKAALDLLDP